MSKNLSSESNDHTKDRKTSRKRSRDDEENENQTETVEVPSTESLTTSIVQKNLPANPYSRINYNNLTMNPYAPNDPPPVPLKPPKFPPVALTADEKMMAAVKAADPNALLIAIASSNLHSLPLPNT